MLVTEAPGVAPRYAGAPSRAADRSRRQRRRYRQRHTLPMNIEDGKQIKSNEIGRIRRRSSATPSSNSPRRPTRRGATPRGAGIDREGHVHVQPDGHDGQHAGISSKRSSPWATPAKKSPELADRVNQVLGENDMQRVKRLVESMDQAMVQFTAVTTSLNDIVGDPSVQAAAQRWPLAVAEPCL